MLEKECIHCGDEFEADSAFHSKIGKINECGYCCEDLGIVEGRLKAFAGYNADGVFEGLDIVTEAEYTAYEKAKGTYADE